MRDRRAAFTASIASASLTGVASGASLGLTSRVVGESNTMTALGFACKFGSTMFVTVMGYTASVKSAWVRWKVLSIWLALRRKLPWRLMKFLEETHRG